eukprot:TRINITY_DN998_c0_g2_i1.p1 TRINITY_DN998_c0_g2~~TRINITY_DN998_c0_g2_i1.p1  ORF type:complete len:383 (+),score=49.85 TRINITY_DN998_c0_g2_i1:52-1200(+)
MENGAIGIDIGSQNSVIAVVRNRGVEVIQNNGCGSTPTAVGLGDMERKLGEGAIGSLKSNYKSTVCGFNRFLGMKQNNPRLKEELKYIGAKYVPTENQGIGFELSYHGEQKTFTPEQLCAMYLKNLKTVYETSGISCKDVVISVPPYFTSVERQAFLDAAKIADLNCLRLMNETTAIGLSYGLFRHSEFVDKPRHVVFVDLGYSKLTVSVIAFKSSQFAILAQGWETNLGARDMDAIVLEKISNDYLSKYKKDPRQNPKALIRMLDAIQKVSKMLSANKEMAINIESVMDDRDIFYNLTRKEFEQLIEPLIEKITKLCKRVMAESKLKNEDIHSIELVGEASRIPIVIESVQKCIGAPTSRTMNSADCIARGCAIQLSLIHI